MTPALRAAVVAYAVAALAAAPPAIGPIDLSPVAETGPRLVAARYAAAFADGGLSGTLEWDVTNPSNREATWGFAPPRVALAELEWGDGEAVRIARLPADRLAVAVPASGGTLSGDWSARSAEDRGARRFEFRFPTAGVATLDLVVPAGVRPVARAEEALRTGPFPADDPARRRWRFSFGGRDRLTVYVPAAAVRTTADPGPVARAGRWSVAAGRAEGVVTFTPDRPFVAWDEATFAIDPSARVSAVTADGPVDWAVDPPTAARPTPLLRVRPLDPDGAARVAVLLRAAPPSPGEAWAVPSVRPTRRVPADDGVVVRVDESLRLADWHSGDYRVDSIERGVAGETAIHLDGTFAREPGADRRAPRLTFAAPPPEFAVAERSVLTADARMCRLHVVATVTVRHGPVTALRITAPAPYRFAAAPVVSGDDATTAPDPTGPTVEVPFAHARGRGHAVVVTFSLVADTPAARDGVVRLAVPAPAWDASERSGTVTVRPTSAFPTAAPVVIAYQDGPPPGDLVLPVALPPGPRGVERAVAKQSAPPNPPESFHTTVRVGRRGLDVAIRGRSAADVPLPARFEVESVRVAERWLTDERVASRSLSIPAGPAGSTFEVRGTIPDPPSSLLRAYEESDFPGDVAWESGPDVVVRRMAGTAWAIRSDVIRGASRLLAAFVAAVAYAALRRGSSSLLYPVAALFGGLAAAGVFADGLALPAAVALAGLGVAHVWPRRAAAGLLGLVVSSPAPATPPVAVTNVDYRIVEGTEDVTVRAVWHVSARGGGTHAVTLPLSGANVSSVRLDGTPTFPNALPGGGLALAVEPGERRIDVSFVVRSRRIGPDRELRFDGPDGPRGTLTFVAEPGTTAVSVSSRRGRQVTDGAVTRADLGEGRTVVVRWRPAGDAAPFLEPTREVTVAEIADGLVSVTTGVVVPASRAGTPLSIRLPEGWVADRATVRRAGTNAAVPADWVVEGPTLIVSPRGPVEGPVAVYVALSLRHAAGASFDLPVVRAVEAPDPRALVAARLDGLALTRWQKSGAEDWPADAAAKALADVGLDGSRPVTVAARRTDDPCAIAVTVAPDSAPAGATQRLSWTLGRRGDVTADATFRNGGATATVTIPNAIRDVRIRGAETRGGRRDDGSYELLRPADDESPVRWAGTLGDLGPGEWELPLPPGTTSVRVRAAAGWVVRVRATPGVVPVAYEADTFAVGPGPTRLSVTVAPERPPAVPPPALTRTADPPSQTPPPSGVNPTGPLTPDPPPNRGRPVAWLLGLAAVAALARYGRGRFRPECAVGLGLLGVVAVGPAFVALVVLGLVVRLGRTVLD